jgi:hypothetical protein
MTAKAGEGGGMETLAIEKVLKMTACRAVAKPIDYFAAQDELATLKAELAELRKDKARLDWLADKENKIGNVQLPAAIVERTLMLRDAIDLSMAMTA